MTMTPEEARDIERAPIRPGECRPFWCEIQEDHEPPEKRLRRFTGQYVTVLRNLERTEYDGPGPDDDDEEFETSRMFAVRAEDGTEFHAHAEELNGWDYDLGQFFWPDGTYGPDHDTRFLVNERSAPEAAAFRATVQIDLEAEDENDAAEKAWRLAHDIENMPDVTNVWVEAVH